MKIDDRRYSGAILVVAFWERHNQAHMLVYEWEGKGRKRNDSTAIYKPAEHNSVRMHASNAHQRETQLDIPTSHPSYSIRS